MIGDLESTAGEQAVAKIKEKGGVASFLQMDVARSSEVQALIAKAVDKYGGLDFAFNNAGLVGSIGGIGVVSSVSTKHGVTGLTKSAALQYATQGIRVNAVAPGLIRSKLNDEIIEKYPQAEAMMLGAVPQKRWGEPEEVAEAVVFLCSDRAAFLTGHVMAIDGGFTAG